MVKLFGISSRKNKKRLSSLADSRREKPPMFQYAINEFAQTIPPGMSNDDGKRVDEVENLPRASRQTVSPSHQNVQQLSKQSIESGSTLSTASQAQHDRTQGYAESDPDQQLAPSISSSSHSTTTASDVECGTYYSQNVVFVHPNKNGKGAATTSMIISHSRPSRSPFEAEMPDATYEESYGDAYTGAPIRYVYPSGYQSMRPRSCPWKLSIVVCVLFTWLSVFIVGHCSDQVGNQSTGNNNGQSKYNFQIDDDTFVIDIRWCGSRPLYSMWVMSMLITGLSAAYCSVIGYIKVRDFSIANGRSQPPGIMQGGGKSDYYVRISDGHDGLIPLQQHNPPLPGSNSYYLTPTIAGMSGVRTSASRTADRNDNASVVSSNYSYPVNRPSIYQADGTPQFWGAHIYRPTQAAVAITSR